MFAVASHGQDITTGQAGHWKFDDSAANTTVTATVGTNATLAGGENTADVRVAAFGSLPWAFDFDGNDSVDTGGTSVGTVDLFADTDNFTVAGWGKTSTASGSFVAKASGTAANRTMQIFVSSGTSKPGVILRGTQSNLDVAIDDGAWHHWALVWNGTTATLYKDGASVGTPGVGAATIEAENIKAGARTNTAANFWTGQIADWRIYSRALALADVKALHGIPWTSARVTTLSRMRRP